jgi:hypothetical protein
VSATASWETQVGIVSALRNASSVTFLLANGSDSIVDEVSEGLAFPYVVVGEGTEKENLYFGQGGHIVVAELLIYTNDGSLTTAARASAGYREGTAIANAIAAVLQAGSLSVSGHDVVMVNQSDDWGKERIDAQTRCVIPKFEITLEDSI